MRTLDEVINKLESYPVSPSTLPMPVAIVEINDIDDALHYLYEHKLLRQTPTMQGIHKMQKDYALYPVSDWGEDEPDFNPPLTWDELKQMVGKPVWIVPEEEKGYWFVIEFFNNNPYYGGDRVFFTNDVVLNRCDLGKSWQAYRKERK